MSLIVTRQNCTEIYSNIKMPVTSYAHLTNRSEYRRNVDCFYRYERVGEINELSVVTDPRYYM